MTQNIKNNNTNNTYSQFQYVKSSRHDYFVFNIVTEKTCYSCHMESRKERGKEVWFEYLLCTLWTHAHKLFFEGPSILFNKILVKYRLHYIIDQTINVTFANVHLD